MKDTKACVGCRDDFYNGKNDIGVKQCWLVPDARIKTRYRVSINTPMNQRNGYEEMRVPHCYRQPGYVFVDKIPGYAK